MREKNRIDELAGGLRDVLPGIPELAIVLGSGLSRVADALAERQAISGRTLPHYPTPSVGGHEGTLHWGKLGGKNVLVLAGRVHLYEGVTAAQVVRPVRALSRLGVRRLILTNAAGSLSRELAPGSIMLTGDYFQLMGPRLKELGPPARRARSGALRPNGTLMTLAEKAAARLSLPLERGVLVALLGPSYETPAEVSLLRHLGASAVTMSTLPEIYAAGSEGLSTLVLSVITNWATGVGPAVTHKEVTARADRMVSGMTGLVTGIASLVPASE